MKASNDNLRNGLAGLADEVRSVDLLQQTLRTSRRLGIQRAVVGSVLGVVLLAGVAGTVTALLPDRSPAQPSATTSPAVVASPSAVVPSARSLSTAPVITDVPGTVYFFKTVYDKGTDSDAVLLYSFTAGRVHQRAVLPAVADGCAFNSITVSPDGKKIAWLNTGRAGLYGDLMVANIDGTERKTLARRIACGWPVWSPDSRVLYILRDGVRGTVSVADGSFTKTDTNPKVFSPDGRFHADTESGRTKVLRVDGTVVAEVPYAPDWDPGVGVSPRGVSADGRYVAMGITNSDPSRPLDVDAVLDMITGKELQLPVPAVERVYFGTDGTMVLLTRDNIYLVSVKRIVRQQAIPPELKNATPLSYRTAS